MKKTYLISLLLMIALFLSYCSKESDDENPDADFQLLNSFSVAVPEPSGLCFAPDGKNLLTVSDRDGCIYELSLEGKLIRKFYCQGDDLEGVACDPESQIIAVVEEGSRKVVLIDYADGQIIDDYAIQIEASSSNKGLEGIAWSSTEQCWLLLNEAQPALLMKWSPEKALFWSQELDFAADYSGIDAANTAGKYWIVSDQSKKLFLWSVAKGVINAHDLDRTSYEGIAIDEKNNLVYLINDDASKLNVYKISNDE